jgi:lysozyme
VKTHHFYYLSITLAICAVAVIGYLLVSEAILFSGEFSKEEDRIMPTLDLPVTVENTPVADSTAVADTTSFVKGIDISKYQKEIDWDNLPESVRFIFCRATEGRTLVDSEFSENWPNIEASERIRGAYHFYRSDDNPLVQAQFFWKTVGTIKEDDLPLVLDIEAESLAGTVNRTKLTEDLLAFLQEIEQLSGKKPMVYSNTYFANRYLTDQRFSDYPLWMAEYTSRSDPNVPNMWKDRGWQFWQRSDSYDLESANGDVDFDVFRGDEEALKAFARGVSEKNS